MFNTSNISFGRPKKATTSNSLFSDAYSSLLFAPQSYLYMRYGFISSEYISKVGGGFFEWARRSIMLEGIKAKRSSSKKGLIIETEHYLLPKYKSILCATCLDDESKEYQITLHHQNTEKCLSLVKTLHTFFIPPDEKKQNRISLIITERGELTTKEFDINIGDIDISKNYGDNFVPVYNKIVERLNIKEDKGIVLLHGTPGTGKTSIIKFIAKGIKKEVIFVPPNMTEIISSPEFLPFLLRHRNSILVIEDAEKIIADRESRFFSSGVSNLLNISDGILGDCLNVQIIATFNTQKDKIDQALLRKGRLIAEYEFKKLSADDSNNLLRHLGKEHRTTCEMSLTDIYNIDEAEYKQQEQRRVIGFQTAAI